MRQAQATLSTRTCGRGLHEVTAEVDRWVRESGVADGLLTVFIRHTSASLTIQENADPSVRRDLDTFLDRLMPENQSWVTHRSEGPDDMPAHVKCALTDTSLAIPVSGGRLALGTWQGLYVFEHRAHPHSRQLVLHLIGD